MLCTKRDDSLVTWKRSIFFSQFRSQRDEPVPHEQGWLACRKRGNTGYFCPCPHICRALLTKARKKSGNFVFRSGIVLVMLCISLTPELAAGSYWQVPPLLCRHRCLPPAQSMIFVAPLSHPNSHTNCPEHHFLMLLWHIHEKFVHPDFYGDCHCWNKKEHLHIELAKRTTTIMDF